VRLHRRVRPQDPRYGSYEVPAGYFEFDNTAYPSFAEAEKRSGQVRLFREPGGKFGLGSSPVVFRDTHTSPWRWNALPFPRGDEGYIILDGARNHADEGDAAAELEVVIGWWEEKGEAEVRAKLISVHLTNTRRWQRFIILVTDHRARARIRTGAIVVWVYGGYWTPMEWPKYQLSTEEHSIIWQRIHDHRRERGWK